MKILIWFLCITVFSVIRTSLEFAGVSLGAIPTVVIMWATVFLPAPALCKLWDRHKSKKEKTQQDKIVHTPPVQNETKPVDPPVSSTVPVALSRRANTKQSADAHPYSSHPSVAPLKSTRKHPPKPTITYCKHCGKVIDRSTKKCTGCGKQYPKAKNAILCSIFAISAVVVGLTVYTVINYSLAISAMYDQQFIKSQRYFDNLLIGQTLFPDEYEYISAGVLMEEGKYIGAFKAFNNLDGIPVPTSITDSLKSKIYSAGQEAYKSNYLTVAESNFESLPTGYKRCSEYLLLIKCKRCAPYPTLYNLYSNELFQLIGFEDTDEIIISSKATAEQFLIGRWTDGTIYCSFRTDLSVYHNFPDEDGDSFQRLRIITDITSGVCYSNSKKLFNISIIDQDTISIYFHETGTTYRLYRQ